MSLGASRRTALNLIPACRHLGHSKALPSSSNSHSLDSPQGSPSTPRPVCKHRDGKC